MADAILEVRGLEKSYGDVRAVDGLTFDVYRGEVLTLLGPSGCGKSTTLRLVAGLEEPDRGELRIRGRVVASAADRLFVPAEKRNVGLVFQSYAVWPHMTVEQNVGYPLEIRHVPRREVTSRVERVLSLVGLSELHKRPATQLSGGQQQRVSLARALAYEPELLLLDEPLSNLDAKLREEMRIQLKALQNRLGTTILYVTHDQVEAMALSHRVAVMRDGKIEQIGPPSEVYESPATYFVQSFVGRTLTFQGVAHTIGGVAYVELDNRARVPVAGDQLLSEGRQARVAIRPEDVTIEPLSDGTGTNMLRGKLEDLIYFGDHLQCVLRVGETEVVLDTPKTSWFSPGQEVGLRLNPGKVKAWPI